MKIKSVLGTQRGFTAYQNETDPREKERADTCCADLWDRQSYVCAPLLGLEIISVGHSTLECSGTSCMGLAGGKTRVQHATEESAT